MSKWDRILSSHNKMIRYYNEMKEAITVEMLIDANEAVKQSFVYTVEAMRIDGKLN